MKLRNWVSAAVIAAVATMGAAPALAQDALARAKETGKVTVGIFNQAPWGFVDTDGQIKGQATDVLKAAFAPLGITEVEAVITEFGALIPGLQSRRFDVIAAGLFINPERCGLVAFGNPDIKMSDGLLVASGNPLAITSYTDIASSTDIILAVARGSAQATNALKAGVPEGRLALYPDNQAALSALLAGRAQAVTATTASVIALAESADGVERALPFTGATDDAGEPVYGYPALAFRQADADFRDAYNEQLAALSANGDLLKILQAYGFTEAEMPPTDLSSADICR